MTTDDINKKLLSLFTAYRENLPAKIDTIEHLVRELATHPSATTLTELHFKVHTLYGSASTYRHMDLAQAARQLEHYLLPLLGKPLTADEIQKINQFLQVLRQTLNIPPLPLPSTLEKSSPSRGNTVHILESDRALATTMCEQLKTFGYSIKVFYDFDSFSAASQKSKAAVNVINVQFLSPTLTQWLSVLKGQPHPPFIFFFAESDDFTLHLRAVRAGGEAYFTAPFQAEELIAQWDNLASIEKEPCRILIVEDAMEIAEFYASFLQQAHMRTRIVTRFTELDRALHEFSPELILLDIYMPDCNGLELAKVIRQRSKYASIPIVFLSSEEDEERQLAALSLGADDFVTKSKKPEHLVYAIRNRIQRYKTLHALMVKDSLTGTLNHTAIQQKLANEIQLSTRTHLPFTVAMIDLDYFKKVNDNYGHLIGDQVLKSLCVLMRKQLRKTDIVGRYGGEEFLVILPKTTPDTAQPIIDRLRQEFGTLSFLSSLKRFSVTFSAGLATSPPCLTTESLIQRADKALYAAKQSGRNRCVVLQ
ncbi:MAG: hypothetical protein A3F41_01485 [Coxiella sp. RIFCSPHIGHO2_12_FULL_44_14]|nr:MAG: hypothetical protein A3F41_01485 [Coxiella sp. RIFCSPHIGHO2_12_FULL_44_14]